MVPRIVLAVALLAGFAIGLAGMAKAQFPTMMMGNTARGTFSISPAPPPFCPSCAEGALIP